MALCEDNQAMHLLNLNKFSYSLLMAVTTQPGECAFQDQIMH